MGRKKKDLLIEPKKVLLLEPNGYLRDLYAESLRSEGFEVNVA